MCTVISPLDCPWKTSQNDSLIAKIYLMHNIVKKGATGPISKYLPWKTTPKLLLDCKNMSTTSEVMEMSLSEVRHLKTTPKWPMTLWNPSFEWEVMEMSAYVYGNLTIRFALKNYPKMTFRLTKSVHWIKSYWDVFIHVSWCVQLPHHWIGLENLPQNDS